MSEETENIEVQINIPTSIYLHRRRPLQETKDIVCEHLNIQAAEIFRFIYLGSHLAQNGDLEKIQYISFCGTLAHIGEGLMTAIEITQNDFDGVMKNASLPEVEK